MKTKILLIMLLTGCLSITATRAQDSLGLIKHSVHVSPFAGYNLTHKAVVYGAEIGYEYRLNKKWGFTAGMNISYTQKNNPNMFTDINNISVGARNVKVLQNALYAGAKYYIGRFYASAEYGYQDEYKTTNYPYNGTGSNVNYGTFASGGFYQAYGLGYQIPLKKGDNIEIFMKGTGAENTNIVTGFRYSFGLSKRKE